MISAVVPWQEGCPARASVLPWVLDRLAGVVDEVVLGELPAGVPWCKAVAVQAGVDRASGDVLVIHDADVFYADDEWVKDCLGRLFEASWSAPHSKVRRFKSQGSNVRVMAGANPWAEPIVGHSACIGGGVVMLPREVWESCPMDARFTGWGQEDESWAIALDTLHGPISRGERELFHLWHPPQKRINRRWGSAESKALWRRYDAASGDRAAMTELIEEGRCH